MVLAQGSHGPGSLWDWFPPLRPGMRPLVLLGDQDPDRRGPAHHSFTSQGSTAPRRIRREGRTGPDWTGPSSGDIMVVFSWSHRRTNEKPALSREERSTAFWVNTACV
ncbi:hypothetical protein EYF80_059070 [Liparis tanakae]|uniref:Uncharacterized protein n=1 Tax=Liparis tanakae TaxID=230148 RepID=A0A4Z2EPE7_9TELE|nr:hypothetical protein EYF80_059070 [Liparis tanakae]